MHGAGGESDGVVCGVNFWGVKPLRVSVDPLVLSGYFLNIFQDCHGAFSKHNVFLTGVTDCIDTTLRRPWGATTREHAPRNGLDVTDAVYNTRSSIRRVSEHHMVPAEVCDGQDPAGSTSWARDIDTTLPPPLGSDTLHE